MMVLVLVLFHHVSCIDTQTRFYFSPLAYVQYTVVFAQDLMLLEAIRQWSRKRKSQQWFQSYGSKDSNTFVKIQELSSSSSSSSSSSISSSGK